MKATTNNDQRFMTVARCEPVDWRDLFFRPCIFCLWLGLLILHTPSNATEQNSASGHTDEIGDALPDADFLYFLVDIEEATGEGFTHWLENNEEDQQPQDGLD